MAELPTQGGQTVTQKPTYLWQSANTTIKPKYRSFSLGKTAHVTCGIITERALCAYWGMHAIKDLSYQNPNDLFCRD